jgi:hypothetical protein
MHTSQGEYSFWPFLDSIVSVSRERTRSTCDFEAGCGARKTAVMHTRVKLECHGRMRRITSGAAGSLINILEAA